MPKIPIHRDNHCGRYCPALFEMEKARQIIRLEKQAVETQRVFLMLSDDQQRKVMARAYEVSRMSARKGMANFAFTIGLAYKYACELLHIEPKTWSTL